MKSIKICIVIAALCCIGQAAAQQTFASDKQSAICNYYGEVSVGALTLHEASPVAERVVQNIMSVIGLHANFELRGANVHTAAAVVKKGKRYILYNPKFMDNINSASGSNWAAISILAHEIGHHLSGHTLDNVGSKPETELEADEFSGFVLQRMGASLADAQAAMSLIASFKGSHSHPPKNKRLTAIATGWYKAGNKTVTKEAIAQSILQPGEASKPITIPKQKIISVTPQAVPQTRAERIAQSVLSDKNIASDAYFASDPNGKYYLTVKGNLVQVDNDKVYLIGSLSRSDKPGYKLMLKDSGANAIYVSSGGNLVNNYGKRVGYLRSR